MRKTLIILLCATLFGCSSTPTVPLAQHNLDVDLYKKHVKDQDEMLDKMNERLDQLQHIIDKQNRMIKNTECKYFCF